MHLRSHQLEIGSNVRLYSIQAVLLLFERSVNITRCVIDCHIIDPFTFRYSLSGQDDYGYIMLNRAISMAESMGIVNNSHNSRLGTSKLSNDMERSLKRTAWGLFQIDTCVLYRSLHLE